MSSLRPEEITSIIKSELENFKTQLRTESVGTVIQVGDAIARIYGLDDVMVGEIVEFPNDVFGMAVNLEEDSVGVIIFGKDNADRAGLGRGFNNLAICSIVQKFHSRLQPNPLVSLLRESVIINRGCGEVLLVA